MNSSGESGLSSPMSYAKWHEVLTSDEELMAVLEFSAKQMGVNVPALNICNGNGGRFHGMYHPKRLSQEAYIYCSHRYLGLVIHEFAHHVTNMRYGSRKVNGRWVHHDAAYFDILQELHNLWGG
jgi:hypothetical protein